MNVVTFSGRVDGAVATGIETTGGEATSCRRTANYAEMTQALQSF